MEEQNGIDLGAVNIPNDEGTISLPNQEDIENQEDSLENNSQEENNQNNNLIDKDKENLKKGVNYERKLRKEAEKKNKELEEKIKALENNTPKKTTVDKLIEDGIDESVAKSIAEAIDDRQENQETIQIKKELADMKFKLALSEKAKEDDFSDIQEHEDEIKELVDKGLSIEQAYFATTYKKSTNTNSEIERKVEAKMLNNQARKEILGNLNSSEEISQTDKNKPKATANEIAMANLAGISVEEYLAAKNSNSINQYNKIMNKK